MVKGGDVEWAGGATRVAKNLGRHAGAPTCRRSSTTPTPQTAVLRNQVIGTQAIDIPRPDPAARVGDGQPGRRRDAREVPRRRRRLHQLRRPAADLVFAAERQRAARRDHVGRDVRRAPVRQPLDDPHADRRPARGRRSSTASRRSAIRLRRRHRSLPADLGAEGAVPLQRHQRRSSTAIWKAPNGVDRPADPDRPGRHGALRHQRLHVHRWRRLHGLRRRHQRRPAGRRPAAGRDRLRHGATRPSTRWSRGASSVPPRPTANARAGPPGRLSPS